MSPRTIFDSQEASLFSNARLLDGIAVVASATVAFGTLTAPLGAIVMSIGAVAGAAAGIFVLLRKNADSSKGRVTAGS